MRAACVALLVFVTMASCRPEGEPERLIFLPPDEVAKSIAEPRVHDAQNPADHVFPKTPVVPFRPLCMSEGYFRDPFNCSKFYQCQGPSAVPNALYCSPGFVFNMETISCDHPKKVKC